MKVWSPGPCPPTGVLRGEGCDLGALLLESHYSQAHLVHEARPRLQAMLAELLDGGESAEAATVLQALVDTWPAAALVDAAARLWTEQGAAAALSVLGRVAELLCLAHGWSPLGRGPWPMPDDDWVRANVPAGASEICRRTEADGAVAVGELMGLNVSDRAWALPCVEVVRGEELVSRRGELARRLVLAEIAALDIEGPVPAGPDAALAMGELCMEAMAQAAFDRYGVAGLLAPRAPAWSEILRPAPAGVMGEILRRTCDGAVLPGTPAALARGEVSGTGWLLWRGPYLPIAVQPEAVTLLGALDGEKDLEQVAAQLEVPLDAVQSMAEELVRVGAATA